MKLFFALWPDEKVRQELDLAAKVLHECCGGKKIRADSIHLTLLFLGEVPDEKTARLLADASAIEADSFELKVDRLSYWKHNKIAWAGIEIIPEPLSFLVAELRDRLQEFDFDRKTFAPHITLLRKASSPVRLPLIEPISWSVSEFCLIESKASPSGVSYSKVACWNLRCYR